MGTRQLIHADCLEALLDERMIPRGSIGLAYIDPPFATERGFEAGLRRQRGEVEPGQAPAFDDRWGEYKSLLSLPELLDAVVRMSASLGGRRLGGYVRFMSERLFALTQALSPRGSLYVHVAPTVAPYLRLVLDALLGAKTFRNEIAWRRTHAHSSGRRYGPVHDTLLFYARDGYAWHRPTAPPAADYAKEHYREVDANGRRFQLVTPTGPGDRTGTAAHYKWKGKWPPPGRHWAWRREEMERLESLGLLRYSKTGTPRRVYYLDDHKGTPLQDVWTDIHRLDSHSDERVGFETQKPLALLDRVIAASAPVDGELVFDGFVGTGTTALAAERANLPWIGVDASLKSLALALGRVGAHGVGARAVQFLGGPKTTAEARRLATSDPDAFGVWATASLGLRPDHRLTSLGAIYGCNTEQPPIRAVAGLKVTRQHLEQLAQATAAQRYALAAEETTTHPQVTRLRLGALVDEMRAGMVPIPPEDIAA